MATPTQKIFRRGQIWHWTDPEHLSKSRGVKIDESVAGYHYSRYVIIVQEPSTANAKNIMVIPIASNNNLIHDVAVDVNHLYFSKRAFAKVQCIDDVNPRCLDSYICEIDKETMQVIDGELLKIFFPSIVRNIGVGELKSKFGIDLINRTTDRITTAMNENTANLKNFFKRHVHYTHNMKDVLTLQDMFTAYEKFCIRNDIRVEDNYAMFCNACIHLVNQKLASKTPSCRFARESTIQNMKFRQMTLVNTEELDYFDLEGLEDLCVCTQDIHDDKEPITIGRELTILCDDTDHETKSKKTKDSNCDTANVKKENEILSPDEVHKYGDPWNEKQMSAFIRVYEKYGPKIAAEMYNIDRKSTYKIYNMHRKKLGIESSGYHKRGDVKILSTPEEKMAFVEYFEKHGVMKTAEKYELKRGSVYVRLHRIKKELGQESK